MVLPSSGLDPSWMQALMHASVNNLIWGKDIVFTYGPWHMAVTRLYHPEYHYFLLLTQLYVWLVLGIYFFRYYNKSNVQRQIVLLFLILSAISHEVLYEYIYYGVGIVLFFQGISNYKYSRPLTCVFLALSGFITLSKLTLFPFYLVLMVLADIFRLINDKKIPLYSPLLVLTTLIFWLLSGHEMADLLPFVLVVKEVIAGYPVAMQATPHYLLLPYIICTSLTILYFWLYSRLSFEQFSLKEGCISSKIGKVIIFLAGSFYIYLIYKVSYTLGESNHYLLYLSSAKFLFVILILNMSEIRNVSSIATGSLNGIYDSIVKYKFIVITLLVCCFAYIKYSSYAFYTINSYSVFRLLNYSNMTSHYKEYVSLYKQNEISKFHYYPVEKINGTIDSYQYDISSIIGLGLDYKPRPVIQTYSAYTPELQKLNLEHIKSNNAPDYLFFSTATLQNKFPTMDLGLSLMEIISRYELVHNKRELSYEHLLPNKFYEFIENEQVGKNIYDIIDKAEQGSLTWRDIGNKVVLKKRAKPLNINKIGTSNIDIQDIFSEEVNYELNDNNIILTMSTDIKLSYLGKLATQFFNAPLIEIEIIDDDGLSYKNLIHLEELYNHNKALLSLSNDLIMKEARNRVFVKKFVPGSAKAGFVISPYLLTNDMLYEMFRSIKDGDTYNTQEKRSIRFHINPAFKWVYNSSANISFTKYQIK